MVAKSIVVVGAGGHAKVVIDCLRYAGWQVVGCTDSDRTGESCAGAPVIGTDDDLSDLRRSGVEAAFCALGSNGLREKLCGKLLQLGFDLPSVIGPGANSVWLGRGIAVLPEAVVNIDSVVEDFAIINTNSNVDHDCVVGLAAHIGPGAALAGCVHIGARSFVATGSSIIPERKVGEDCTIGAGSVVVRDIPSGCTAFGNPARVRKTTL